MPPTINVTARDALQSIQHLIDRFFVKEKQPPASDLTLALIDSLIAAFPWSDSVHGQEYWNNVRLALNEEARFLTDKENKK